MFIAIFTLAGAYIFTGFFISLGFWLRGKFTDRIDARLILRDKRVMDHYVKELQKLETGK